MKSLREGALGWMARNKVAANLLMLLFLIGGYVMMQQAREEVFPQMELDMVLVVVSYPGASPAEIESGILDSVEVAIGEIEGIKRVTSKAIEGSGEIVAELLDFVDQQEVLQDIKNAVDRIQSFPEEAKDPVIRLLVARDEAISLIVYGEQSPQVLRQQAEKIKADLIKLDGITLVEINNPQRFEIALEVSEEQLRRYRLNLPQLAEQIKGHINETPAGVLKTTAGEVLVRTGERRDYGRDLADIPILRGDDGGVLRLDELATIRDGFSDSDLEKYYDGKPAVQLKIYSVGQESPVQVARLARAYIDRSFQSDSDIQVAVFNDRSRIYQARIELLMKNAFMGLILVLLILGVFLDPKLAFWVMMGLPISIFGAFLFFNSTGASLNMISLFAFIITIGIVVDDAIIVGEAIYEQRRHGGSYLDAAILGVREMAMPVTFAVLTNITAFLPLMFVPGFFGDIFRQIPAVVISVLTVSLIEALFIMPAHLSYRNKKLSEQGFWMHFLALPQRFFSRWMDDFTYGPFSRFCQRVFNARYLVVASGLSLLLLGVGVLQGGYMRFSFLPRIDSNTVRFNGNLPYGAPLADSRRLLAEMVARARQVAKENDREIVGIYSRVGNKNLESHAISAVVELTQDVKNPIGGGQFALLWRRASSDIIGLETMNFRGQAGRGGSSGLPIQIAIGHPDKQILEQAAKEVADQLGRYNGVTDIDDGLKMGKRQIELTLKPEAEQLGISAADLARQIRGALYGLEITRQQRQGQEVTIMLRLSEQERSSLALIEDLMVYSEQGHVPLTYVTDVKWGRAHTEIVRTQGRRVLVVAADVDDELANAEEVTKELRSQIVPDLQRRYPGLFYTFDGEDNSRQELLLFLRQAFLISLLVIYALLAIPFASYFQPFAVMLSIPFGIIGAFLGHFLLGFNISIISLIGIVGLSGIVINDALVLMVTLNRRRKEGVEALTQSAVFASTRRFRPILMTSLTTFFGLIPILFETSIQARFLIPMAISISFGVLFATIITLFLVPSLYLIAEDIKGLLFGTVHSDTEQNMVEGRSKA